MAIFHRCDRCGKEIDPKDARCHNINFRISVSPRIRDNETNEKMQNDTLNGLEFCEECAKFIVNKICESLDNIEVAKHIGSVEDTKEVEDV